LNAIGNGGLRFKGVFDGNGHTVSNLRYRDDGEGYAGLFGLVGDPEGETAPVIKDLGLIAPDVNSSSGKYVGSLVGRLSFGAVENCYSQGGQVFGNNFVGGLVGYNFYSVVTRSSSSTSVSGPSSVGGLVGRSQGYGVTIEDSYAKGNVSGGAWVGGLVGSIDGGQVVRSYSVGVVSAEATAGGLTGTSGSVSACFWDIESSGCTTSPAGTGLETAEMQAESTFTDAGWDFVGETANGTEDIWAICQGTNYPRLVWQIAAADFLCPDGVNFIDYAYFGDVWNTSDPNADLDLSGLVDPNDLKIFCGHWLEGI
jgi:hypothetical protein